MSHKYNCLKAFQFCSQNDPETSTLSPSTDSKRDRLYRLLPLSFRCFPAQTWAGFSQWHPLRSCSRVMFSTHGWGWSEVGIEYVCLGITVSESRTRTLRILTQWLTWEAAEQPSSQARATTANAGNKIRGNITCSERHKMVSQCKVSGQGNHYQDRKVKKENHHSLYARI